MSFKRPFPGFVGLNEAVGRRLSGNWVKKFGIVEEWSARKIRPLKVSKWEQAESI